MKLRLEISISPEKTIHFEHGGPKIAIGRDPGCELHFEGGDQAVSWRHALLELTADGAFLRDLDSTNGTFVSDKRIDKRTRVETGDHVRLGQNGPYLKLTLVDLSAKSDQDHGKAAGVSPRPLPEPPKSKDAAPDNSNKQPKPTLATRMYVSLLESRYRKLWIGSGIGAACIVLFFGVILVIQGGSIGWLWGQTKDLSQQAQGLQGDLTGLSQGVQKDLSGLAKRLDDLSEAEAEAIFKKNGDAVYLVQGYGTAFAVDSSGIFATNGHIAKPVHTDELSKGKKVTLISQGGIRSYEVIEAKWHPRYKESENSPDVGILKIKLPPGDKIPVTVQLASDSELQDLAAGSALCYIGFPHFPLSDYDSKLTRVNARVYQGRANRLLTFTEEKGDFATKLLIEHDMYSWGGSSGSPLFNKHGKVVGIHFGADVFEIDPATKKRRKSPAGPKWGVRVDLLRELLPSK